MKKVWIAAAGLGLLLLTGTRTFAQKKGGTQPRVKTYLTRMLGLP